jgi:hypothetical protein
VYYFCGEAGFREARTFPAEWFAEKILAVFEGHSFWIPKDYDKVLTAMYGPDYMELPPEGKRAVHPREMIDCGDNARIGSYYCKTDLEHFNLEKV